ncbi:hypothetical protein CRU98_05710 [Arcobacter sp. CECT 8986]|uniref:hypothetical protein n=1 Tax=Arcobacter sp. CECT 8986 TaxID=2044507 RepID=UPI001009BE13|nr:hypothetical protein [Arcobacter sp. CECT 8986]RXJ99523.1 hypothetical protein CRU98_05710 [Arcobacter sp. CECT 8986]
MSADENKISVVDTTDIKKLIKEMTVVNTQILSSLIDQNMPDGKVKEGLISQLNGAQQILNNKIKLLQLYLDKAERVTKKLETQQEKVEENETKIDEAHQERFKELEEIKSDFKITNEVIKDFNEKIEEKIKIFENSLDLRTDEIYNKVLDEINKFRTELAESLKAEIDDVNKSIKSEFAEIDLQSIKTANTNAEKATKTLSQFIDTAEKYEDSINSKYIIAVSLFCFTGGGAIASLFFYFFK